MSLRPIQCLSACAALVCLTITQAAGAGEISTITPFPGIVSVAGQSVTTTTVNNDNVVGLGNPNKLFVLQKDYSAVGPVDIVIGVIDTGGTTEYEVREGVQNSTGVTWSGYRVLLGFGVGGGFVQSTPGDGLNFDDDNDSLMDFAPGAMDFITVIKPNEDVIEASDGDLLTGQFSGTDIIFHIEVPDGITEFTLRQEPIPVPEPTSAALLGLLGAAMLRRRRA